MKASRHRLANLVATRTLRQGASKRFTHEVAAYLLAEHQVDQLNSLLRDVQADWEAAGYIEVLASTAHPLSSAVKADIRRQVKSWYPQAKQVIITEVNDPAVIGGVRLSLANQQLDLSVEAKLNKFKQLTIVGKD